MKPQAPLKHRDTERAIARAMRSAYLIVGRSIIVLRRADAAEQ